MADIENHFTVFIKLPFNRGTFVDPPPVAWSAAKERALWDVISRQGQGKGNEIDWHALATQFQVTQPFILQQAAWLYERQLSQVRAQLRKVGNRQSATPSPAPGSMTSSTAGAQPMKRAGSGGGTGSRGPSRLSTQHLGSPVPGAEGSAPSTPAKSRTSIPLRSTSGGTAPPNRPASTSSRPLSRQPSKEDNPPTSTHSRRGSTQQQQLSRSPGQVKLQVQVQDSDSDGDESQSKFSARRANIPSTHRRTPSLRKDLHSQTPKPPPEQDDDDAPSFLPFAAEATSTNPTRGPPIPPPQDPSATLRGVFPSTQRPHTHRRSTSERILSPTQASTTSPAPQIVNDTSSSASSPSKSQPTLPPALHALPPRTRLPAQTNPVVPGTLSPRQQAFLRHQHRRQNSESSPSMGSSFSDLDDASVTQSALEEALLSGMGGTTTTMNATTNMNTVASRVSGIGMALRSRYFEGGGGAGRGGEGRMGRGGGRE